MFPSREALREAIRFAEETKKSISVGQKFSETVSFTPEWCMRYLDISGDKNLCLHTAEGLGLVQGMAVLTRMGGFVGTNFNGWMGQKILDDLVFTEPTFIGDTLLVEAILVEKRTLKLTLEVSITKNELPFWQKEVHLAHPYIMYRVHYPDTDRDDIPIENCFIRQNKPV